MAVMINSMAPALADRLSVIYDELKVCTDAAKRKQLEAERDIKRDVLKSMIDTAYKAPRKRK